MTGLAAGLGTEDLLPQDVRVPAVLRELAQGMQVDPAQRQRAEALGAQVIFDRTDDAEEPLYVFADLAGHPFCIFVA